MGPSMWPRLVRPGQATVPRRVTRVSGRDQTQVVLDGLPASETAQPLFAHSGPGAVVSDGSGLVLFIGPAEGRPQGSVVRLSPIGVDPSPAEPLVLEALRPSSPLSRCGVGRRAGPRRAPLRRPAPGQSAGPGGAGDGAHRPRDALHRGRGQQPLPFRRDPLPGRDDAGDPLRLPALSRRRAASRGAPRPGGPGWALATPAGGAALPGGGRPRPNGLLCVLEFASGYDAAGERWVPRSGRVVAIGPEPTRRRTVVRDVDYPTALAFAPNGDLYVTEGAFRGPGEGRVLLVPGQSLRAIQ